MECLESMQHKGGTDALAASCISTLLLSQSSREFNYNYNSDSDSVAAHSSYISVCIHVRECVPCACMCTLYNGYITGALE